MIGRKSCKKTIYASPIYSSYLDLKTFFPVWNNNRPYGINCSGRIPLNRLTKYLDGFNVLINSFCLLKSSSLSKSGVLIKQVLAVENLLTFSILSKKSSSIYPSFKHRSYNFVPGYGCAKKNRKLIFGAIFFK